MAPKWRSFYARSRPGYAIWRHLENLAGRPNNSETNNSFIINNVRGVEQTRQPCHLGEQLTETTRRTLLACQPDEFPRVQISYMKYILSAVMHRTQYSLLRHSCRLERKQQSSGLASKKLLGNHARI